MAVAVEGRWCDPTMHAGPDGYPCRPACSLGACPLLGALPKPRLAAAAAAAVEAAAEGLPAPPETPADGPALENTWAVGSGLGSESPRALATLPADAPCQNIREAEGPGLLAPLLAKKLAEAPPSGS